MNEENAGTSNSGNTNSLEKLSKNRTNWSLADDNEVSFSNRLSYFKKNK